MAGPDSRRASRRSLLKHVAAGAGLGLGALVSGCRPDHDDGDSPESGRQRLRAAFSTAGLAATWNKAGREAALLWGRLLDVEVEWFDGELDGSTQRRKIEAIVDDPWDFCAFQSHQIGILEEPVKQFQKRGIPVISMDTLLVERNRLRDVGVWTKIASDHVYMAEISVQYLIDKINGQGKVLHIGGESAHSGAQDREKGFSSVISEYPKVEVVGGGVHWCGGDPEKARKTFQTLLEQSAEPIAGAFFHNDDMALSCVPLLAGTRHESMVITAVDGQNAGLCGVRDGKLAATVVNPSCMIHGWSLMIGQFIVRNREKVDDLPLEIVCPSPLVARETGNLDAMFYLNDPKRCLL